MNLRISRMAYPITTLGYGARLCLWVQGCSIRCKECISKDMWDPHQGQLVDAESLARKIASTVIDHDLDGVSISGGEPSEQAQAVALLVELVRSAVARSREQDGQEGREFDVLIFSGRKPAWLQAYAPSLWNAADALVCGPYDATKPSARWLVASRNQSVQVHTELGKRRYGQAVQGESQVQLEVADGRISIVGIPAAGDMDVLSRKLAERGIELGGCSWKKA